MELSIIIPTFNRSRFLEKNLRSIINQQQPEFEYEVIVIDNGSTDDTKLVCENSGQNIKNFVYCFDDEPGLLTGRHKGFSLSKGQVLSYIDDDAELNPNWVQSIVQRFKAHPEITILGGPSLPKYESDPPQWVEYFWQPTPYGGKMCLPLSLIDMDLKQAEIDPLYVFGLNYSIRKEALLELNGFHPDCIPAHLQKYQGDGETGLSIKAGSRNYKAMYLFDARIHHHVTSERLTPEYFEKWHYYDGVCQSYTDIRRSHHLYEDQQVAKPSLMSFIKRAKNKLSTVFPTVFNATSTRTKLPAQIAELRLRFQRKYHEGYAFHQRKFMNDELVKRWVLKPDYWQYRLPGHS